jgi:hypothetical protein
MNRTERMDPAYRWRRWLGLFNFQGAEGSPFIIYYFVFTISICQHLAAGSGPGEAKGRAGLRGNKGSPYY